jgi:hypothetical protein
VWPDVPNTMHHVGVAQSKALTVIGRTGAGGISRQPEPSHPAAWPPRPTARHEAGPPQAMRDRETGWATPPLAGGSSTRHVPDTPHAASTALNATVTATAARAGAETEMPIPSPSAHDPGGTVPEEAGAVKAARGRGPAPPRPRRAAAAPCAQTIGGGSRTTGQAGGPVRLMA